MNGVLLFLILVARNLVPAAGVFFLGWEPQRVLLLFFIDTWLGLGAVALALGFADARKRIGSKASRAASLLRKLSGAVVVFAFIAIPLGIPLVFMFGGSDFSLELTLRDWSFQRSVALQGIASLAWCVALIWRIRAGTLDEKGLKLLGTLVFLRWFVLVGATFMGIPVMLGRGGPYALVLLYAAAMIFSELQPDRFIRMFGKTARK